MQSGWHKKMASAFDQFKPARRADDRCKISAAIFEFSGQRNEPRVDPAHRLGKVAQLQDKKPAWLQRPVSSGQRPVRIVDVGQNSDAKCNIELFAPDLVKVGAAIGCPVSVSLAGSIDHGLRLVDKSDRPAQPVANRAVSAPEVDNSLPICVAKHVGDEMSADGEAVIAAQISIGVSEVITRLSLPDARVNCRHAPSYQITCCGATVNKPRSGNGK